MRDHRGVGAADRRPREPFFTWSPVPGASRYELQFAPYAGYCDWSAHFGDTPHSAPASRPSSTFTETHAWAVARWGGRAAARARPPGLGRSTTTTASAPAEDVLHAGPRRGRRRQRERVDLRQRGAADRSAPARRSPTSRASRPGRALTPMPQAALPRAGGEGAVTSRTPYFTWDPVPGARQLLRRRRSGRGVHRGRGRPLHPRAGLRAVQAVRGRDHVLLLEGDPGGAGQRTRAGARPHESSRTFQKRSLPPALIGPADGEDVPVQPVFRWTSAESAATYRLQVASDPGFGELLDDVTTAATAYASTEGLSRRHAALLARPCEHARRVAQLVADPLVPAPPAGAGDRREPRWRRDDPGPRLAPGPGRGLVRPARRPGRRHAARLQHALDALHADAVLRHRHLALEGARQLPGPRPGRLLGVARVRAPPQRSPGRQGRPRAQADAVHVEPGSSPPRSTASRSPRATASGRARSSRR